MICFYGKMAIAKTETRVGIGTYEKESVCVSDRERERETVMWLNFISVIKQVLVVIPHLVWL